MEIDYLRVLYFDIGNCYFAIDKVDIEADDIETEVGYDSIGK